MLPCPTTLTSRAARSGKKQFPFFGSSRRESPKRQKYIMSLPKKGNYKCKPINRRSRVNVENLWCFRERLFRLARAIIASEPYSICLSRPIKYLSSILYTRPLEPKDLGGITKEWLNYALLKYFQSCSAPKNCKVIDFKAIPFENGVVGQTGRVYLTYNTENHLLPASIVIKLSRKDLVGRIINVNAEVYREIFFYKAFANSTPLKIPELLYSKVDPFLLHACDFILVTEDIHPSNTIIDVSSLRPYFDPQFDSATNTETKSAKRFSLNINDIDDVCGAIAKHHAKFLNDKSLIQKRKPMVGPKCELSS